MIDTHIGAKRECFCSFEYVEANAKTGDVFATTSAGHWAFGPIWSSCQRRQTLWSHIGVIYRKHDNYKEDLPQEYIDKIEANPEETLFVFEGVGEGATMNPVRPLYENNLERCLTAYMTIYPIKEEIRNRISDLEERFYKITSEMSEGSYQFNPCECVGITLDVWPCGCNCCACCEKDIDYEEEELKGVCTEYGSRTMQGLGYFDEHESDTKQTAYLKYEMNNLPHEELICNDLLNQTYLFDHDKIMIICGTGCGVRPEAPNGLVLRLTDEFDDMPTANEPAVEVEVGNEAV